MSHRRPTLPLVLPFLLASTWWLPKARADDEAVLPLAQVRAGMEGTGRTVFEGARIDEFKVRILGVLENALGPKQSLILARLDGGPLAQTGVIAGMSGSPVFVDGKMVGAISYAFPFGKEPIAGITPIGEMIEATRTAGETRAASTRFHAAAPAGGFPAPLDRASIETALRRPLRLVAPGLPGESLPSAFGGVALSPLALPLVFSGFDPATFGWARGIFSAMGFAPVMGGAAPASIGPLPQLAPGSAVGVSLIEGDLDLSVTGTITRIDHDRIYAFGHPFYNLGPTQFPLKKAWVYSVFPSLQVSWKIAAATDAVGVMDQDRTTAIAGRLGAAPRMIPVQVTLHSARGGARVFRYRMVDDELFTPLLAYVSLLSVIQGYERAFGAATLTVDSRVTLNGGREVHLGDVLAAEQPGARAAAAVASPLALLVDNDFEKLTIERLDVTVDADETLRSAAIVRAWVDAPLPLHVGATAPLRVQLQTRRGRVLTETLPLAIPLGAPAGRYSLLVSDAPTMDAVEQREMRQRFAPRDVAQLVRALNRLRSGSGVYARLTRPGAGAVVGGEFLPALPGSVLSVLDSADQGTSVVPLASAAEWSAQKQTEYAVSGSRQLTVDVQP